MLAGDRPRVRAPRREEEPHPRPHQVPGREARHRRVPAARARGARQAASRPALDGVPRRPARRRREAAASRRQAAGRPAPRRLRGVARDQRLPQRQAGYVVATVTLPLGDITSEQMRALADIARKYAGDTCARPSSRTSCSAGCSEADLPDALRGARRRSAWPTPGAGTIVDITACPGTDTCKLGISSSRGLAGELRTRLRASGIDAGPEREAPAHQGERLLQLLRPAPRRRHRLLRHQPQRRRAPRAALPGGARRPVDEQRRLATAWRSARCRRSASPRWSKRLTDRFVEGARRATSPSRTSPTASARRRSAR